MNETTTAYLETFGCHLETEDDHDHPGDCEWGFACSACGRRVDDEPCPDHAPADVPGLQLADCDAQPRHPRTWFLATDSYPPPCMYCSCAALQAAHQGCEHSHHRAWRRWKLTHRLAGRLYSLGVVKGYGLAGGGGCNFCLTGLQWGRSGYLLGWDNWKWQTLARCLRRGHWPADTDSCVGSERGLGFCVKCAPCTGCWLCQPETDPRSDGPWHVSASTEPPRTPYQLPGGTP